MRSINQNADRIILIDLKNAFIILGNEVLHLLTSGTKQEVRVDLQKFSGEKAYAKYATFSVGSKSDKYKLTIGGYQGTAGKIIRKKRRKMIICERQYEILADYLYTI